MRGLTPLLAPIAGADLLAQLDAHGWAQGDWETDDGRICAHQAIRLCQPVPGDACLIEQVAVSQGWGTRWNDDPATTEADVRRRLGAGVAVTDDELEGVFGPQWRAVVALARRAAVLTAADMAALAAARAAAAWDLAAEGSPYPPAQRDLLMAPWAQVCGLPEGLVEP